MKIAIVTGASSGLGKEFVKQIEHLYKELDEIWVIARRRERLEELKSCMFTNVRILEGNLCEQNIYQELKVLLKEKEPDIRMLVNAAGFGKVGEVKKLSAEDQLDMIELNCKALTHMTKICIPYMTRGSRIVNVASAAAFCPQPSFSVYAATKSYVLSFSRSLRTELCDEEIFVTAVCPGPVVVPAFCPALPPAVPVVPSGLVITSVSVVTVSSGTGSYTNVNTFSASFLLKVFVRL